MRRVFLPIFGMSACYSYPSIAIQLEVRSVTPAMNNTRGASMLQSIQQARTLLRHPLVSSDWRFARGASCQVLWFYTWATLHLERHLLHENHEALESPNQNWSCHQSNSGSSPRRQSARGGGKNGKNTYVRWWRTTTSTAVNFEIIFLASMKVRRYTYMYMHVDGWRK